MILTDWEMDLKQYGAALSRLMAVANSVPQKDPGAQLLYNRSLAKAYEANKKYPEAVEVYGRIVKDYPNDSASLNNLAYLMADRLNQAKEALPLAERVGKLLPDDPQVQDTLGWVRFKAGQVDGAYDSLRKSVDKAPQPASCYHLAEVLRAKGSFVEANEMYRKALDLAEKAKDQETIEAAKKRLEQ